MAVKCDICGAVSNLDETYRYIRTSFSLKKKIYCPECHSARQVSSHKGNFWLLGAFLLLAVIVGFFDPKTGWQFFGYFLFLVFLMALIIPHELGHALVARWLNMHVFRVIIGSGKILSKFRFLGFNWEMKRFPFHGLTLCFAKSKKLYRLKRVLVSISGPAVNMALAFLAFQLYRAHEFFEAWSISLWPVSYFVAANGWLAIINLIPVKYSTAYGQFRSDGLSLLRFPFVTRAEIMESICLYYALAGSDLRSNGQIAEAMALYQEGLSACPDNPYLLNEQGFALMQSDKLEEAKALFEQAVEKSESQPQLKAIAARNLAYVCIAMDQKELLEKADAYSAIAFESFPWIDGIKSTRGIVLVELGRLEEGIRLLKESYDKQIDPRYRATDATYLSIAAFRKGNRLEAMQYLEISKMLNSNGDFLERAKIEAEKCSGTVAS